MAVLSEAAGDAAASLDAWRTLAAGLKGGSPEWFRAKYETARLLAESEPAKALELLDQVAVLYPDLGPEPWNKKLKELRDKLKAAHPAAPSGSGAPAAGGSGGGAP
jgi:hypothetical protein